MLENPGKMSVSELMDIINNVEDRFPVDQWKMDGINVWPLIRIMLFFDTYNENVKEKAKSKNILSHVIKHFLRVINDWIRFCHSYFKDHSNNANIKKPVDIVISGDGISFVRLGNSYYQKNCDPFIESLRNRNISSLLLTQGNNYYVPRFSPSYFIQPRLDFLTLKGLIIGVKKVTQKIDGFDNFLLYLRKNSPLISMPSHMKINAMVSILKLYKKYFLEILKKVRASAGIIVNYYSIEGMAFNLACREFSIPVIDIQHGVQGEFHIAYGRWNKVPSTGYELLPTHFWCWSEHEASAIQQWSGSLEDEHEPIIGGNLWLMNWKYGKSSKISLFDPKIIEIKKRLQSLKHVLISLQPGFSSGAFLATILKAVMKSEDNLHWWFRLHPGMINEMNKIREIIKEHNINHYELETATHLPLYAILRNVDVHVTLFSSVVIEAESFGVPSVIVHQQGEAYYREHIASGWAVTAYTDDAIIEAIQMQLDRRDELRRSQKESEPDPDDAFDYVLKIAGLRKKQGFNSV